VARAEGELREQTIIPRPHEPFALKIRDEDDAWVLASAVAGHADLLVTGDQGLLDVAVSAPIRVLSPRDSRQWLRG
jgi:predicted nucleic acid-binding protein